MAKALTPDENLKVTKRYSLAKRTGSILKAAAQPRDAFMERAINKFAKEALRKLLMGSPTDVSQREAIEALISNLSACEKKIFLLAIGADDISTLSSNQDRVATFQVHCATADSSRRRTRVLSIIKNAKSAVKKRLNDQVIVAVGQAAGADPNKTKLQNIRDKFPTKETAAEVVQKQLGGGFPTVHPGRVEPLFLAAAATAVGDAAVAGSDLPLLFGQEQALSAAAVSADALNDRLLQKEAEVALLNARVEKLQAELEAKGAENQALLNKVSSLELLAASFKEILSGHRALQPNPPAAVVPQ
jgi:hypothetical protein